MVAEDAHVQLAQEGDGLEVLAPAMHVRDPLARLAAVVEVEHRGDGIDAQPVDVEALEPVERVGDEEVAHLAAAEIVDQRVPVAVEAEARVLVLVERGAVEAGEAVRVGREMRRHPVEDDADAGLVAAVDEAGEILRRAEAAGRREQADRLVAPGAVERMLADRQQLDMGEAHVLDVGDQLVGELVIGEEAVAVLAPPGAEMHLVDRDRRGARLPRRGASPSSRASPQSWRGRPTTREAVAGGCSCSKPTGSAFSGSSAPSAPSSSYL